MQKPFLQNANQFQLLPQQQQQQLLAQVQTQGNLGGSPMYGDMDPQRLSGLSRGALNTKEGQPAVNDGSIGSPMQSTSSKVRFPFQNHSLLLHYSYTQMHPNRFPVQNDKIISTRGAQEESYNIL